MTAISATPHMHTNVHDYPAVAARSRINWSPILMGAVTAIGLQFIFTVLGIAVGATVGDATEGDGTNVRTVSMVAGLWWLISGTLALAFGGYVLGRLSGLSRNTPLKLEAMTMWGVVALFGFLVVWSGAGMLSQAVSPIAAMSAPSMGSMNSIGSMGAMSGNARSDISGGQMATTSENGSRSAAGDYTAAAAEEARRATRTASWWALIGLIAGVGAAVGGATAGASNYLRNRDDNAGSPERA